jgi:DHA1 family bicyclomycin/chloramphenicol resistance-like MFS transporter
MQSSITLCTVSAFAIDMYLPAISQIAQDLSTTPAKVSMPISSYFIRLGAGQLFYAPMLDRFGRKRPLMTGTTLIGLAIFLAGRSRVEAVSA